MNVIVAPLLSPLFAILNPIADTVGKVLFSALGFLPKWASLCVLAGMCGVVMIFAFKFLSNQPAITRAKDDISANLLALKLYKDELRVTAITQLRLLWSVLRLQRYALTPVLTLMLPMLLMLGQMGTYFQWETPRINESVLLRVGLQSNHDATRTPTLIVPGSIRIDAGPIASQTDVAWRLTPTENGMHTLTIKVADQSYTKELACETTTGRVSAVRPSTDWTEQLLHPIETPIPPNAGIQAIKLDYEKARSWFCGGDNWVISFLVVSMTTALLLKPAVGVRF